MKSSGLSSEKSTTECASCPHKSLSVVVLGTVPTENACPIEKLSKNLGKAPKVKVVWQEIGHVD